MLGLGTGISTQVLGTSLDIRDRRALFFFFLPCLGGLIHRSATPFPLRDRRRVADLCQRAVQMLAMSKAEVIPELLPRHSFADYAVSARVNSQPESRRPSVGFADQDDFARPRTSLLRFSDGEESSSTGRRPSVNFGPAEIVPRRRKSSTENSNLTSTRDSRYLPGIARHSYPGRVC